MSIQGLTSEAEYEDAGLTTSASYYALAALRGEVDEEERQSGVTLERKPSQYDLSRPDLWDYRLIDRPALERITAQIERDGVEGDGTVDKSIVDMSNQGRTSEAEYEVAAVAASPSYYASAALRCEVDEEARQSGITLERKTSQYDLRRPDLWDYRLINRPALERITTQIEREGIDGRVTVDKSVMDLKQGGAPKREYDLSRRQNEQPNRGSKLRRSNSQYCLSDL